MMEALLLDKWLLAATLSLAAMHTPNAKAQSSMPPAIDRTLSVSYSDLGKTMDEDGFLDFSFRKRTVSENREIWESEKSRSYGTNKVGVFQIVAAGNVGSKPDIIAFWLAPVNGRDEEVDGSFRMLQKLVLQIFPNWSDSGSWIETASREAWKLSGEVLDRKAPENKDTVVSTDREGVWIDVFGVPPDYFFYVVTTRQDCLLRETLIQRRENPCLPEPKTP